VGHEYTCFIGGGEDVRLHERFHRIEWWTAVLIC